MVRVGVRPRVGVGVRVRVGVGVRVSQKMRLGNCPKLRSAETHSLLTDLKIDWLDRQTDRQMKDRETKFGQGRHEPRTRAADTARGVSGWWKNLARVPETVLTYHSGGLTGATASVKPYTVSTLCRPRLSPCPTAVRFSVCLSVLTCDHAPGFRFQC